MKSLILTVLYLAKDTVHRWLTRLSSPIARVLVVFFLTLCALCFLGSYVISAKVMRDRIRAQGGDLVHVVMMNANSGPGLCMPNQREVEELLNADSYAVKQIGFVNLPTGRNASVYTFDFSRIGQFLPLLAPSGGPTLLEGPEGEIPPGPGTVSLNREKLDVFVRRLPEGHLLLRLIGQRPALFVQPDSAEAAYASRRGAPQGQSLILRARDMEGPAGIARADAYFRALIRLERAQGQVTSALPLLKEMDVILGNQTQCRAAFCLGIACIVGILLTALAGMEYRQNEYIYTLMKSFGIHPLLLVGAFIAENLVLVGASFIVAVEVFMRFQSIIVAQFFKMGKYSLTLDEIMPELQLIALSLLGCVLVSSIPIVFAANRDIGRVLK